jgi:putative phosphoribosyl transferase
MAVTSEMISITAGTSEIAGGLIIPPHPQGVVLFAHGSGSSPHSPRNAAVAEILRTAGLATLLLGLLTDQEERVDTVTAQHRFDIGLLTERLLLAVDRLNEHPITAELGLGLFGTSTGAAAALVGAAGRPGLVRSVVCRGGRPDLAGDALSRVRAPVLLIVGSDDTEVLRLNREAAERLSAPHRLDVVPGATHLFEEPGALERVAEAAAEWFLRPGGDLKQEAEL